jgi:YtkA-like
MPEPSVPATSQARSVRSLRHLLLPLLLGGCSMAGSLGAPCDVDRECDDGLTCDLHASAGSCQRAHAHDGEPVVNDCSVETRDDEYVLGLEHQGSWAKVALIDAIPAPPSRGDNTWTVRVLDESSTALDDLEVTVDPFMPDHGHGSTIRCHVEPGEQPGTYVLSPVNLFMPGLWEVTIDIARDDGMPDAVMFSFCVDP